MSLKTIAKTPNTAAAVAHLLGMPSCSRNTAQQVANLIQIKFSLLQREISNLKKCNALACQKRDEALAEAAQLRKQLENITSLDCQSPVVNSIHSRKNESPAYELLSSYGGKSDSA